MNTIHSLALLFFGVAGIGQVSAESYLGNLAEDPGERSKPDFSDSIDAINDQSMLRFALRESGDASSDSPLLPGSISLDGESDSMLRRHEVSSAEEDGAGGDASAEAQANNPLANMTAFNVQNYYIGELTGPGGDDANQFWLRYAQPLSVGESLWLLRVSLPVNTFPTAPTGGHATGLGDINAFAAYLFDTGNPAVSVGLGPQLTVPSATDSRLGSEQWSAGLAHVLFDGRNPKFQWGYLLTWQHSFAGDDGRPDVNVGAFQPFVFYQLGSGWYLRAAPIWVYNFENDSFNVPIGIGLGKVIRKNKVVYNLFVEPQVSVWDDGPGQPEWQIYFAVNMQFLK
ncbi:hypothetical protein [Haloferula sp.]|uniref:hypothetical protein n=1 Tax=Haloferula sp. TaxID=2497595 RepID=UPI0032A0E8B1